MDNSRPSVSKQRFGLFLWESNQLIMADDQVHHGLNQSADWLIESTVRCWHWGWFQCDPPIKLTESLVKATCYMEHQFKCYKEKVLITHFDHFIWWISMKYQPLLCYFKWETDAFIDCWVDGSRDASIVNSLVNQTLRMRRAKSNGNQRLWILTECSVPVPSEF